MRYNEANIKRENVKGKIERKKGDWTKKGEEEKQREGGERARK